LSVKNNFRIWAEVVIPQLDNLRAGLLVTFADTIIGVIELKYIPYGFPRYENNFQKFEKLRQQPNLRISLHINPSTGLPDQSRLYTIDASCLFVFAAIARYNSDAFHDHTWERLSGNKLMLTGKIDSPDVKLFEVSPEFGKKD
jgi:hypothetical protein